MTFIALCLTAVAVTAGQSFPADGGLPPPPVVGPQGQFGQIDQAVAVKAPVWESDGTSLTVRAGLRNEIHLATPDPLRRLNLAVDGTHLLADGWVVGGGVNFDSAATHYDALTATLTPALRAFVRLPGGEAEAWTLSVAYTAVGEALPAPSVSYTWAPSSRFSADLGLPVPLVYTPGTAVSDGRVEIGTPTTITGQVRFRW